MAKPTKNRRHKAAGRSGLDAHQGEPGAVQGAAPGDEACVCDSHPRAGSGARRRHAAQSRPWRPAGRHAGLAQGEMLGSQRRDIELDASPALLHVRRSAKEVSENGHKVSILGETKTPSSKRDIEVPAPLAGKIREHLATYVDKKPTTLLFTGVRTRGTIGDYD